MRRLFPAPAPETPKQFALAARPLWQRLALVLCTSALMLAHLFWSRPLVMRATALAQHVSGWIDEELVAELSLVVVAFVLVSILADSKTIGLRWRGSITSFVLALPILALGFLDFSMPAKLPGASVLVHGALVCAMIGIAEETYGRGLLVALLGGWRRARLAIVGSAVGFAYLHMPGYVQMYGWHDAFVFSTQSVLGSIIGAIIALRSGSIVGLIAFHAIDDCRTFFDTLGTLTAFRFGTHASLTPLVLLGVLALVYWLACRNAIQVSAKSASTNAS